MDKDFKIYLLLVFLSCVFIDKKAATQEYRMEAAIEHEFYKNFECGFSYEKRLYHSGNIESIADIIMIESKYSFSKVLSAGVSYRTKIFDVDDQQGLSNIDINDNQRFTVDLGISPKLKNDFKLKNRIRFHYSFFDDDHPEPYLRDRLVLEKKVTSFLVPYLGYELFFDLEDDHFSAKRFYLGSESEISERIDLDVYYIKEEKREEKHSEYILGIALKYKI